MYSAMTSLSSKGQIVLPAELRKKLSLREGRKFFIFSEGKNIMLKPVEEPDEKEFFQLLEKEQEWARKVGLKESDITEAIKKVRASHK
ncbi:MAG: AbrB/MazE/SpoVT family DNA-binding domain-containing protein [Treponema sp.]|nr:AbrB/MazE/SpoVT family DNA-binding domain-containing protein [Treponema sp.]